MPVPEIYMQVCSPKFSLVGIGEEWVLVRVDSSHPKVHVDHVSVLCRLQKLPGVSNSASDTIFW